MKLKGEQVLDVKVTLASVPETNLPTTVELVRRDEE